MLFRYSPLIKHDPPNDEYQLLTHHLYRNEFESNLAYNCTNGTRWIFNIFGDCVDTPLKHAGFAIGFISLLLWLVPMLPQLYTNYRNKRCEGLCGDFCNMLGAIMTHQQPLQQIIGVYYIIQDFVLLSQYAYYTSIYPNRVINANAAGTIVVPVLLFGVFGTFGDNGSHETNIAHKFSNGRVLSAQSSEHQLTYPQIFENSQDVVNHFYWAAGL